MRPLRALKFTTLLRPCLGRDLRLMARRRGLLTREGRTPTLGLKTLDNSSHRPYDDMSEMASPAHSVAECLFSTN